MAHTEALRFLAFLGVMTLSLGWIPFYESFSTGKMRWLEMGVVTILFLEILTLLVLEIRYRVFSTSPRQQ